MFGPQPRDYAYNFPQKKRLGALRSALSEKIRQNHVVVVDKLELDAPKTKEFIALMDNLQLTPKLLVVDIPRKRERHPLLAEPPARSSTCPAPA